MNYYDLYLPSGAVRLDRYTVPSEGTASLVGPLHQEAPASAMRLIAGDIPEAVTVEGEQIVTDPSKMAIGLGYPVRYKNRQWWAVNVDGSTIRLYRGPKS